MLIQSNYIHTCHLNMNSKAVEINPYTILCGCLNRKKGNDFTIVAKIVVRNAENKHKNLWIMERMAFDKMLNNFGYLGFSR